MQLQQMVLAVPEHSVEYSTATRCDANNSEKLQLQNFQVLITARVNDLVPLYFISQQMEEYYTTVYFYRLLLVTDRWSVKVADQPRVGKTLFNNQRRVGNCFHLYHPVCR
jgi:hypothetical protein